MIERRGLRGHDAGAFRFRFDTETRLVSSTTISRDKALLGFCSRQRLTLRVP
jgi:hypothetical protein